MASDCEENAVCWDFSKDATCSTSGMNRACHLKCPTPIQTLNATTTPSFCQGRTSMYMEGFRSMAYDAYQSHTPCILLFFNSWVLDQPWKFALGCLGVFALGASLEGLIKLRRKWSISSTGWAQQSVTILLFWINISAAYLCMLVAMTFSIELFLCVVSGLAFGHWLSRNHVAPVSEFSDPCCAPHDDEENTFTTPNSTSYATVGEAPTNTSLSANLMTTNLMPMMNPVSRFISLPYGSSASKHSDD